MMMINHNEPVIEERPKVLIADDEISIREVLSIYLEQEGFEVHVAIHAEEACAKITQVDFSLVLSDLRMPRGGGMKVLEFLRLQNHEALVIMMTAYASPETAVEAMKLGAHDYLIKPFQLDSLKVSLNRALDHYHLKRENRKLKEAIRASEQFEGLIGRSSSMKHIFELIERVAPAKTPILVMGESGTGKEMVAKAIHTQSTRAEGPFVALNCAALPEHLLESTLFGHRRGAFTGATEHRRGLFQAAHEGTLFLDEIGEMPLPMQAKVLRALQEQRVMAVGSLEEEDVNLRVIAATNRPLLEEVRASLSISPH
jgi:two-component system, NtrC family, response regulator PilR